MYFTESYVWVANAFVKIEFYGIKSLYTKNDPERRQSVCLNSFHDNIEIKTIFFEKTT